VNRLDSTGDFLVPLFRRLAELLDTGGAAALASVIGVSGSVPGREGMKLLMEQDGGVIGTVGGGALENEVLATAERVMEEGVPRRLRLSLRPSAGEASLGVCGGEMEVYVEPIGVHTLYLFGAGHVAHAVSAVASRAGFRVVVFDEREEYATRERFPDAAELHVGPFRETFARVRPGSTSYLCLVTRGHVTDEEVLELALAGAHRYVGMIGSRTKVAAIRRSLLAKGIDEDRLGRVRAPIGLDIGARTPGEIAVSIVAELILERYGGADGPRSREPARGEPGAPERTDP